MAAAASNDVLTQVPQRAVMAFRFVSDLVRMLATLRRCVHGTARRVTPLSVAITAQSLLAKATRAARSLMGRARTFRVVIVKPTPFKVRQSVSRIQGVIGTNTVAFKCASRSIVRLWIIRSGPVRQMLDAQATITTSASTKSRLAMPSNVSGGQNL